MSSVHRSKPASESFLTSRSLSFSSRSSSFSSWDDAIELKATRISCDQEHNQKELSNAVTHVKMPPTASPPPLGLRPAQIKNNGYDPERIPASVFSSAVDNLNWSEISNDSLFSLKMEGCRMSNFRQSNIKPEDLLTSGEFLAYSPFLSVNIKHREEEEEEISQVKVKEEIQSREETQFHQKKFSSYGNNSYIFGQAPPQRKLQPFSLPAVEKKKCKKRKQTNKKKNKCCVFSWLSSKSPKCCSYCITPKALVSSSSY